MTETGGRTCENCRYCVTMPADTWLCVQQGVGVAPSMAACPKWAEKRLKRGNKPERVYWVKSSTPLDDWHAVEVIADVFKARRGSNCCSMCGVIGEKATGKVHIILPYRQMIELLEVGLERLGRKEAKKEGKKERKGLEQDDPKVEATHG